MTDESGPPFDVGQMHEGLTSVALGMSAYNLKTSMLHVIMQHTETPEDHYLVSMYGLELELTAMPKLFNTNGGDVIITAIEVDGMNGRVLGIATMKSVDPRDSNTERLGKDVSNPRVPQLAYTGFSNR